MNIKLVTAIALVLLAVAIPTATSQEFMQMKAVVKAPFPFQIGTDVLPAGRYEVRHDQPTRLMSLTNVEDRNQKAVFWAREILIAHPAESSNLIFSHSQGRAMLHQMHIAGDDHYHDIVHPATTNDVP